MTCFFFLYLQMSFSVVMTFNDFTSEVKKKNGHTNCCEWTPGERSRRWSTSKRRGHAWWFCLCTPTPAKTWPEFHTPLAQRPWDALESSREPEKSDIWPEIILSQSRIKVTKELEKKKTTKPRSMRDESVRGKHTTCKLKQFKFSYC